MLNSIGSLLQSALSALLVYGKGLQTYTHWPLYTRTHTHIPIQSNAIYYNSSAMNCAFTRS